MKLSVKNNKDKVETIKLMDPSGNNQPLKISPGAVRILIACRLAYFCDNRNERVLATKSYEKCIAKIFDKSGEMNHAFMYVLLLIFVIVAIMLYIVFPGSFKIFFP